MDIWDWMQDEDLAQQIFAGAVKKAIAETHAAGLPSCHASDREGYKLCFLFPDGHKEYFNTPCRGPWYIPTKRPLGPR